jgi:hypothetical protein
MFDKIGQVAEKMAVSLSRRAFLGRLGTSALAVAGVLGFTASADAGPPEHVCCSCQNPYPPGTWSFGCYPGHQCPQGCKKVRKEICGPSCS